MPMPSNIFSLKSKTNTADISNTNETITSTPSTTTSNSTTNNKKTKYSYQSINKNFNQFFTNSHQATASSPSSSASSSATFHHSAMMPSVASRLKKNIARTKEKFLQNIGKTDRTNDESFDLYVENFEKQHSQASRLTKELNKYVNCLKETQKSSRLFYEILRDTYEPNWPGSNEFAEQIQIMEIKWNDYLSKLINEVQSPLIAYLNEFPELKKKIEKRDNRLLDYDNARHTLEAAQHKSTKKQLQQQQQNNTLNNSNVLQTGTTMTSGGSSSTSSSATDQLTKLTKLKIELEDKQQNYEEMNQTLCMSLPVLYENRIKFYSSLFQTFFHTETIFHSDCLEVESKLDDLCESLCTTTAQQVPSPQKLFQQKQEQLRLLQQQKDLEEQENLKSIITNSTDTNNNRENDKFQIENIDDDEDDDENGEIEANIKNEELYNNNSNKLDYELIKKKSKDRSSLLNNSEQPDDSLNSSGLKTSEYDNDIPIVKPLNLSEFIPNEIKNSLEINSNENNSIQKNSSHNNNTTTTPTTATDFNNQIFQPKMCNSILKNRCLYKVKATYAYDAKELDELSFVKEDIIDVVEGSESEKEDLDDGWLIGVHETSLKRGLFPENFTRRL
jgi:amphiphysin